MKKIIIILAILILLLTSCLPETPPPPYGVWVSEEPQIILFLTPEYQIIEDREFYFGIYIVGDVERKVFAQFTPGGGGFEIYNLVGSRSWGGCVSHSGLLLAGTFRLISGEIHYHLTPHFQEELGIETIIFQRVEDYEPIDPEWIANFVPRP